MKFKLDENLPRDAVHLFQSEGYDAMTVIEQHLEGEKDANIARICQQEQRTLVTLDLDFADIRTYPPSDYSGIIVLRPALQSLPGVQRLMTQVLIQLKTEIVDRKLWIVDES